MAVVEVEVVGDDGDRQASGEDAGERAQRPDDVAARRLRVHVAVADGRQRDDRPPVSVGDREEGVRLEELGVVDDDGEDQHDDEDEDEQHQQLAHARLQRQHQDLDGGVVAREPQHATDAQHAQHHDGEPERQQLARHQHAVQLHDVVDPHRQDAQHVDDVHHAAAELQSVRRDDQPDEELDGEEARAEGVDVLQDGMRLGGEDEDQLRIRLVGRLARDALLVEERDAHHAVTLEAEAADGGEHQRKEERRPDLSDRRRRHDRGRHQRDEERRPDMATEGGDTIEGSTSARRKNVVEV